MTVHEGEFYDVLADVLRTRALPLHDRMVKELIVLRAHGGRLFCIGVGGGAANAAHAACDFRKLCGIEAYAPTDGIAELTARANDEGWETVFVEWLTVSRLAANDAIMVFSVGGGTETVSKCISDAVVLAKRVGARVLGVVGKADGVTARLGDVVIVVGGDGPFLTPVTEIVQVAVLHALVSDPRLQVNRTKW